MGSQSSVGRQKQNMISRLGARKVSAVVLALSLSFVAAGCKKKAPAPPPPPPPKTAPPPAVVDKPNITQLEAEPTTIEKGQASTLRWAVSGQTSGISIAPGIGSVDASGNRQVYPSATTTYTLTANGPGGTSTSTATVTVTSAVVPPPPTDKAPTRTLSDILKSDVKDAFFDYDKSDIREDARAVLTRDADVLKTVLSQYPNAVVIVEGHADERGSAEYNLGLSDRRATAAKEFLVQLGVPADRLKPVSYGKERPQCTESNESCWQRNRRAHFEAGQ
jgi:peptidoglycan-associated lipoprotein